ncbi:MAG TPA: PfkB family carbohydrate kinase [Pyrinomonadaceae bacterium]|nr:PfkB family carbohydrate kinase [Pyrinomonadaceae bacterium]
MTAERTLLQERLVNIVHRFPQQRVVVIGDSVADQFLYGAISRVSREAPVLILQHEHTETVPGGAANCALNIASLGGNASLVSVVGDDPAGQALLEKLKVAGVDCGGVVVSSEARTTTKVRILAGQLHSTRQQVIRVDYEGNRVNGSKLNEQLRERALTQSAEAKAVVVSDYNYGVVDSSMADFAREIGSARNIHILADSRFRLADFHGFTSATPNQDEVEQLLGKELNEAAEIQTAAEELRAKLGHRALLVTRGGSGMTLIEDGVEALHLEAVGASEPVDVTGAGDTVMATYALALASDSSFPDAARLANYAGGLVVMKRGTASISSAELKTSIIHSELS